MITPQMQKPFIRNKLYWSLTGLLPGNCLLKIRDNRSSGEALLFWLELSLNVFAAFPSKKAHSYVDGWITWNVSISLSEQLTQQQSTDIKSGSTLGQYGRGRGGGRGQVCSRSNTDIIQNWHLSFQSNLYVVFLGECKRERQFCAQHNDGTAVKAKEIVDMKLSQGNIFPNHVSFRPLLIT